MKHKARIILNYDGTLWYEIEGENIYEITSEITKVYECKDFFEKTSTLINRGLDYFQADLDTVPEAVTPGQISSDSPLTTENGTESQIRSE